ncbi:MAG: hypothetical protein QXU18_11790 [Thermoplasmatales archaeon]
MEIIEEEPIISLDAVEGYGDLNDQLDIFLIDIQKASIGYEWMTDRVHVTRSAHDQMARLIYKDEDGAAILVTTRGWYDNPSGEMHIRKELIWVPFDTGQVD